MAQARIVITAQDKTKQGINSAKSNLKGLNDVANSLGINLGKLSATTAIVAGLTALAKCAKDCTEAFLKTENTYLTLKATLSDTKSYDKAINSIDKLSKYTLSTKEDVAKLYTELAQLGKSDTEINKIITASISLSNVTGKSLTESFNVMLDSLDGSTGTLQKYLPEVKNLTKEELALGEAIDIVNEAFSETAKSISAQSYSQQIKNIKDDVQTISEDIGYIIKDSLGPVFDWIEDTLEGLKDTVAEWRKNVEGKSTVTGKRDSATKNSASYYVYQGYLDNRTSKGGLLTGTSLYTLKGFNDTIVNATSALEAYSAIMELAEGGLLSVEDSYAKEVLERCRSIDATVDLQYEELRKQTKNSSSDKYSTSSSSSADASSLWLSDATRANALTLFSGRFEDYFNTDFKKVGAEIVEGMQDYEYGDTDRAKQLIDYGNKTFERNVKISLFDRFIEILKSGGDILFANFTEAQIDDIANSFTEIWSAENERILSEYQKICNEVLVDVDKALSSNASNYLSEDSYEGYTEYVQLQLLKEVQELAREAELIGSNGDPRVAYLKEIASNIENGIIPNLKEDVNGLVSSNTSALSPELQKFFERQTYTDAIAKFDEILANMQINEDAGFEYYSDETWQAVKELKAYSEKALSDYDKGISGIASFITSNASYLSDETLKAQQIKTAEEQLNKTDDMINALINSGDYSEEQLLQLREIRKGQQEEINALKNSGLNLSVLEDSFNSFFENFSAESIDSSLLSGLSSSFSELFEAIGPLIEVILSSNPIIAFLILIIQELSEILSPFLSDTIKPFTDLIHSLAESLSGWILPVLNVIKGVLAGVCDILEGVFLPILEMIAPLIEGICGILQILKPIMEWLKSCFIEISTIFTFVGDAIKYAIWGFLNWLDSINIWGWRPFEGVGGYDVSTLDSYDSNTGGLNIGNTKKALKERYSYDASDWKVSNGEDTSTSTSVSTASYTGSNNYYFNIYQQAPVVGDGGMQEFAKMIKMEFAELAYMGA